MNQVWLFFYLLDLISDSICMLIHILGSLYHQEPLPHNMIFCGTFAGFIMVTLIRSMRILFGLKTRLHPQLAMDCFGIIMHFLCALLSLHYAETDFHLIFMGAEQELDHPFFGYCKKQSIACIIAGALYLVQFVLILDFIYKTPLFEDGMPIKIITKPPEWDESYQNLTIEEHDNLAKTHANVYLFGRQVDHWLRVKSRWFRQLAGGQELIHKSQLLPNWRSTFGEDPQEYELEEDEAELESIKSKKDSKDLYRKTTFKSESRAQSNVSNQNVRR